MRELSTSKFSLWLTYSTCKNAKRKPQQIKSVCPTTQHRIPVGGARFPAPVQTGPSAHPSRLSFPGVKRPGRGVYHPPPSSAEVKERVELYLYSPLWIFVACSRVNFIFYFTMKLPDFFKVKNAFIGCVLPHVAYCSQAVKTYNRPAISNWQVLFSRSFY